MSKICENCGNMIPDGVTVCPNCGREDYIDDTVNAMGDLVAELSAEQASQPEKKPAVQRKAPQKSPSQSSGGKKNGSQPGKKSGKKKKKRKKKNSGVGAALIIVIIVIVALLLVAAGAVYMLYQMGFFVQMSDEELLQTPGFEEVIEPSVEEELPEISEEPVVEEPSVVEESIVEEPVEPEEPEPEVVECDKFEITGADDVTLYTRGETVQIVYSVLPSEAERAIEWESSDTTVATVSDFGVISARRGGNCTITGTCGDKKVTVNVYCSFTVPTTIMDMNYEDITMSYEGQTVELFIDYDLTEDQVESTVWESSDETIATVNEEGLVTAVSDGTAIITASIDKYTASCIVRCVNVTGNKGYNSKESEYVINYEDVTLTRKGEYFQLELKSVLGNEMPEFKWTSSDSKVATVNSKGIVTAVANGTAEITTTIGEDKFRCIVRVNF